MWDKISKIFSNEMDILVGCHCNEPYKSDQNAVEVSPKLSFNVGNNNSSHNKKTKINIYYSDIDEKCPKSENQFGELKTIEKKFDLVWFQYCPIFSNDKTFIDFIETGKSLLKINGKLITPTTPEYDEVKIKTLLGSKYVYRLLSFDELPYNFVNTSNPIILSTKFLVIFNIKNSIGGGKTKKITKKITKKSTRNSSKKRYTKK